MAIYKKKVTKKSVSSERLPEVESKSTTAHIFKTLDTGASKTGLWIQKHQRYVFGVIGLIVLCGLVWFLYLRFVQTPKEEESAAKSFWAQQAFNEAASAKGNRRDSLYLVALEGNKNGAGYLKIIQTYGSTKAANIAHYAAGVSYLNLGKYNEAIKQLQAFKSEELMLSVIAKGAVGDAYVFLEKNEKALQYYLQAIEQGAKNALTTPKYLFKAALVAYKLGKNKDAVGYLSRIKEEFSGSEESRNIDLNIARMQQ